MKTLDVEVRQIDSYWSVYVDGRLMVDRESYTVANSVAEALRHPETPRYTESDEVAHSIREWLQRA